MRLPMIAALALTVSASLSAQDIAATMPVTGNWSYSVTGDGSEAMFATAAGAPQLWAHCARATRRVLISKSANAAAPFLNVWSSSAQRNLLSAFNPASARLTAELGAYDPLLDALANSRGRVAVGVSGQVPLVMPPWPELARVIEDCRS
jgi:hypothetical protein